MRRKERQLDLQSVESILIANDYGVLSTVDSEGQPYGVPVNYVFFNDAIFFHSATKGHKIKNLTENPRVSFCVVGKAIVRPSQFSSDYESVILFGTAAEIFGEDKLEALHAISNRFAPAHEAKGNAMIIRLFDSTTVIKITIDELRGKARNQGNDSEEE
jgi:nitroimidazol reductase NimA-like FMN-containing flavoprotein (pyridoxamine 5'-phosphate oxidase superfamily)